MIKAKMWNGEPYRFIQEKLDGNTLTITNVSGLLRCWTSTPSNITDQLKSCGWMAPLVCLPGMTTVYGELWLPGQPASMVKRALVRDPASLRFTGFAIDKPFPETASIDAVDDQLLSWGIQPVRQIRGYTGDPRMLLERLPVDVEGYVLKTANMVDWFKLKPEPTIELIVTGTKPGKGKNSGLLGALLCSTVEGFEVCSAGAMNDEDRIAMTKESPIDSIVEIAYQYVGSRGRLRHPRFKRFRDDRTREHCTVHQDPHLRDKWI